jgi:nitrous oxidase accessory protein
MVIPITAMDKDDILDNKPISKSADVPTWEVGIIENNNGKYHLRSGGYIQALIDNASAGDNIYIPAGIYYENIIINKSISLVGEDKNTTIIDGGGIGHVVEICNLLWVNISGFTIQNSRQDYYGINAQQWPYFFHHCIISDNKIIKNSRGIDLQGCYNIIEKNIISNNYGSGIELNVWSYGNIIDGNTIESNAGDGISLVGSRANKITGNTIESNNKGLRLAKGAYSEAKNNEIFGNIISNNVDGIEQNKGYNTIAYNIITLNKKYGIHLVSSVSDIENNYISNNNFGIYIETSKCTITNNTIDNNKLGIYLKDGNSFIQKNNFVNNTIHAGFKNYLDFSIRNSPHIKYMKNNWEQNYWGEEKESPKIIHGVIGIRLEYILGYIGDRIGFPWINIDWHPAKEPYDIQVGI